MECINEDCIEETENAGGLCKACMGLAQKRAELTRQAAERHRQGAQNRRSGDLSSEDIVMWSEI